MDLFSCNSYKEVLEEKIKENQQTYGYQTLLAEAAHCHRSYLSQVLSGKKHLSADQLLLLANFWGFTSDEISFLMDNYLLDKGSSRELQEYYQARIRLHRKRKRDIAKRIKKKNADDEEGFLFYSSWINLAIYTLSFIPSKRTVEEIARHFRTSISLIQESLTQMLELGILEKKGEQYIPRSLDLHLSKSSPFLRIYQANWRDRAMEAMSMKRDDSVHYTAIHTMSRKDYDSCMEKCLKIIEETRKSALESKDETELVCMNLDWFQV